MRPQTVLISHPIRRYVKHTRLQISSNYRKVITFRRLSRYVAVALQLACVSPRSLFALCIILIARFNSSMMSNYYRPMNGCKHALSIQPVFAICLPLFVAFIKLAYV